MRNHIRFSAAVLAAMLVAGGGLSDRSISEEANMGLRDLLPWPEVATNIFLTDKGMNDSIFVGAANGSGQLLVPRERVETALRSPDCWPAERDPQGHWGPAVGAWQLSLRLPRGVFAAGEPIPATVLLRNLTTNQMDYTVFGFGQREFPVTWVREEDGVRASAGFPEGWAGLGPKALQFRPRTQRAFQIALDQVLPTNSPGTYLVSVRTRVREPESGAEAVVASGEATVQIRAGPGEARPAAR